MKIGWLAPNGEFYECSYYDHIAKAEEIIINKNLTINFNQQKPADDILLAWGWAKLGISLLGNKQWYVRRMHPLTPNQRYFLKDSFENPDMEIESLTIAEWEYEEDYFNLLL